MIEMLSTGPMHTLFAVFAGIFGGIVGSFLNVCAYRLPREESVVTPRSRCPKCGNAIAWYDNVPVLSWLILRGKCRQCGEGISWRYPLVEAITAALFLLVFLKFGFTIATPVYMYLCAGMVLITFVDLATFTIPNEVTLPGIMIGIVCSLIAMFIPESGLVIEGVYRDVFDALLGILVGGGVIYLLDKFSLLVFKKPGMGMGDVKLLAMLGAFFGWKGAIMIILVASLIGSMVGGILLMTQRKKTTMVDGEEMEGHYIPFGPYLAAAGIVVMFFGAEMYSRWLAWMRFDVPV